MWEESWDCEWSDIEIDTCLEIRNGEKDEHSLHPPAYPNQGEEIETPQKNYETVNSWSNEALYITSYITDQMKSIYTKNSPSSILYLPNHLLVCKGIKNGVYCFEYCYVLCRVGNMFQGPHEICWFHENQWVTLWVLSLQTFRKNYLNFDDYLSFDRSCFLSHEGSIYRLQQLRLESKIEYEELKAPMEVDVFLKGWQAKKMFLDPSKYTQEVTKHHNQTKFIKKVKTLIVKYQIDNPKELIHEL